MIPTSRIHALAAALVFAGGALLQPAAALGQERVRDFTEGDGRIHGAPVLEVSEVDLHPGQVQTINLNPGYHTILEFPYPVARVDAGDPEVFLTSIVGNKLTLKATKVVESQTSMSVILGDADLTVVPFLIRADSTQPSLYVVRYTDPVSKHLNSAEARIAQRLEANVDARVDELAERRLQQRLLYAGPVIPINKSGEVGDKGQKFGVEVETAQELPSADGSPKLYIRYRILNGMPVPLNDLYFVLRLVEKDRKMVFFSDQDERELYDVQDVRTVERVPPGASARGLLIIDAPDLQDNQHLTLEAVGFRDQRRVVVERILVGG